MTQKLEKLKLLIPFLILFALLTLLYRELFFAKPTEMPSALIGESLPDFQLPILFKPKQLLTPAQFRGKVSLLNVWATWCYACSLEMPMLLKITKQYHVPIYGLAYKDDPKQAQDWLIKYGNPYVMIGNDHFGDVAIDLGVYGTPETFVISPAGKIIYRHVGVIDQKTWDTILYPLLKKYGVQ